MPRAQDTRRDRELLERLASGGADALAGLYDRHAASLFRHAVALTRRRTDAEDLVQAVFVKLATTGAALLGVREPAGYLHRMVHTTWIDVERKRTTGARAIERLDHARTEWPRADAGIDVARALDRLPPLQREAIVLRAVEGFSFREIGKLTGVSIFTAAGRYRSAIARMRALLRATDEDTR